MQAFEKGRYSGSVTSHCDDSGIIATLTAYDTQHFNGERHYHDNAHFSFVIDGGCIEKKKTDYEITPGNITYYSPGEAHQVLKVAKPSRRFNVEVEKSFLEIFDLTESKMRSAVLSSPNAKFLMVKILSELLACDQYTASSIRLLFLNLTRQGPKELSEGTPPWIKTIRELLNDRWNEQISLRDLSDAAFISPVTISKYFPVYFACTLGEYMRKLKVDRALSLIKSSSAPLTEISFACGFSDQSHFTRTSKNSQACCLKTT